MKDASILETIELSDLSGRVILYDWSGRQEHQLENLICINSDGSLRWKAKLPHNRGPDCFVAAAIDGDQLRANTFSGFAVWLDPSSGAIKRSAFMK